MATRSKLRRMAGSRTRDESGENPSDLTRSCSGRAPRSLRSLVRPPLNGSIVGRTGMSAERELDERIPVESVLRAARKLLDSAGWALEFDGAVLPVPREPQPAIISRAYVKAHAADVFLGDHYE